VTVRTSVFRWRTSPPFPNPMVCPVKYFAWRRRERPQTRAIIPSHLQARVRLTCPFPLPAAFKVLSCSRTFSVRVKVSPHFHFTSLLESQDHWPHSDILPFLRRPGPVRLLFGSTRSSELFFFMASRKPVFSCDRPRLASDMYPAHGL